MATLSAPRWGTFLNTKTDNKDNQSCLIDLKTLRQSVSQPDQNSYFNYAVSVQPTSTNPVPIDTHHQAQDETEPETAEEVDDDTWARFVMMKQEMTYDNIHEKLFWRFFKDCDKNIDLILEINIF